MPSDIGGLFTTHTVKIRGGGKKGKGSGGGGSYLRLGSTGEVDPHDFNQWSNETQGVHQLSDQIN